MSTIKSIIYDEKRAEAVGVKIETAMSLKPYSCRKEGTHPEQIGSIICAVAFGKIIPYTNNRGNGSINRDVGKRMEKSLNLYSIGAFTLGWMNGRLMIVDGHSRIEGIMRKIEKYGIDNQMEGVLNTVVNTTIVPEKEIFRVYENLNSGKAHSGVEKMNNPDYCFGDIISMLKERMEKITSKSQVDSIFRGKKITQLAYLIYWFAVEKKPFTCFQEMFGKRNEIKEISLCPKDSIVFTDDMAERFLKAMVFYSEYYIGLQNTTGKEKTLTNTVCSSGPLFGLLMGDHIENTRSFGLKALGLVNRSNKKLSVLSSTLSSLTGGKASAINNAETIIRNLIAVK